MAAKWWGDGQPELRDIKVRLNQGAQPVLPSEIRKGEKLRYTYDGESWDYLVTDVSEPDWMGAVTLQVEPA